jgi:hypothetical protein
MSAPAKGQGTGMSIEARQPAPQQATLHAVKRGDPPTGNSLALPPDARRFLATLAKVAMRIASESNPGNAA